MKRKGIVAIVGRPNVGKSSLFNRIIKERKSIVEETPGVTRDRIYGNTEWLTREFIVIDTGGISLIDQPFAKEIKFQTELAMQEADEIVFVVSFKDGVTDDDRMVARILYKTKKPIILVVNKYDQKALDDYSYEFLTLGLGNPFFISSTHGIGIGDLLDEIVARMPKIEQIKTKQVPQIAIIGKPNVGKSSLVNSLVGDKRMIVSEIAGTTLDSIDTKIKYAGKDYILIDTAGIRRKGKIEQNLEKYSYIRSVGAINNADIVILMLDISQPITDQDTNIGGLAFQEHKPIIIVANKWDLVKNKQKAILEKEAEIRAYFKYLQYARILFISTKDKTRIQTLYQAIDEVQEALKKKIQTSVFNEILNRAQLLNPAPSHNGGRLKIYYGSQVEAYLPTFVLFVNNPNYLHFSYKRYLENQIRLQFNFQGVPITLLFRERR